MATLPTASQLTSVSTTAAEQKTNFTNWRDYCSELLGTDSSDKAAARTTLGAADINACPSVKDDAIGAVGNGVADDYAALQAALDADRVYVLPPGKYRITQPLIADPARNRNNGFVAATVPSRYPYTQQTGGPTWDGTQECVIFYDGATSTTAAVIAVSAEAVGTEPASSFDNTIWGFTLRGVTLDANSKAGFGLYTARAQGLDIDRVKCRGATVAGASVNGTYSGVIYKLHCYLNPGRGFELGGEDSRSGWTTNDKVNALQIIGLHCEANGSDSTFRESDATLKKANCGFYFGPHRGVSVYGVTSENNFGANIVYEPSDKGNSLHGVYTELGCKYAPGGAGTDAISLGYATQQWGLMFIGSAAATHNRVVDGTIATDRIWLTGTEPTAAREEGGFELQNVSLAGGVHADWGNYRLVNCALELESITGTSPVGAFTIKGGLQFGAGLGILDYFNHGTFTPSLAGITTAGTGWAYSVQAATYTRVGPHVFFTGRITLSAVSGDATGQIAITGLPFTVKNGNNYNAAVSIANAANLTTSVVALEGVAEINTTRVRLYRRTAAATSAGSLVLADLSATTTLTFSGHYVVA